MRQVSAGLVAAIRGSHTRAARVSVLAPDLTTVAVLPVTGGTVTTDRDRRRSCSLVIANDGSLTPTGPGDHLFPNALLRAERGVVVGGSIEWVTLGTFLVDRPQMNARGATISVTGQDRLKLALLSSFTRPAVIDMGTPVGTAIQSIAQAAGMGSTLYQLDDGGKTLRADRFFEIGDSRVEAMRALARDHALDLYVDADGQVVVEPALTAGTLPDPVWTFSRAEDGLLLDVSKDWSDERLHNHVLVTGEGSNLPPISAEARDLNPASPAYNPVDGSGPIGDRLFRYSSPLIRDAQMAQDVADALLLTVALVEETLTLPTVVVPHLEAGDVVTVSESVTATNDQYIIDTLTIPLGTGAMTASSRKVRSLT